MLDSMPEDGTLRTARIAVTRPSQRFVDLRGVRVVILEMATVRLASVMESPEKTRDALSVNVTRVSLSAGVSRLTTVFAACLVISRMDRPVSSSASLTEAEVPMEPDTSITNTT